MKRVNVADAKAHLSAYLREVKAGETFLICERNVPIAEVRAYGASKDSAPRFGTLREEIWITDDALAPLSTEELHEWDRPIETAK